MWDRRCAVPVTCGGLALSLRDFACTGTAYRARERAAGQATGAGDSDVL